jgi:hypothetical protein
MRTITLLPLFAVLVVATMSAQAGDGKALKRVPVPAALPAGAQMAILSGDPGKPGPFTMLLAMPTGYRLGPHFHPTEEDVEVKKGTLLTGIGDAFDASTLKPMPVGEKGSVPPNVRHFGTTKGATVILVTAMGPFSITYVNPADDPQKRAKP